MRILTALVLAATAAEAEPPSIVNVVVGAGAIDVTLRHPDTGWDHYADAWRVLAPDGAVLAERILLHPHVTEQPFTRSTAFDAAGLTGELSVIATCNLGDASAPYRFDIGGR